MADGAELTIDTAQLARDGDKMVRRYLSAGTSAVAGTTRQLERKLETATQAAVPGRLWRAWSSEAYPRTGPAQNPAGIIYLNGRTRTQGALKFWTEPGAIRGKRNQWLAIPTPAAGPRGRSRDLTPGEWERAHGIRLRFIYRPGKPGLLVADGGTTVRRNGTATSFRPLTKKRSAADLARGFVRGEASAIIFVLVPIVRHRAALSLQPLIEASEGELTKQFFEAVRGL